MENEQRACLSADEILEVWEKNHGSLEENLRDSFREHPAVQALVLMDGALVADAISREPKLKSVMAHVRCLIKQRTQKENEEERLRAAEDTRKAAVRQKMRDEVRPNLDTVPRGPIARAWVNHNLDALRKPGQKKSNTKERRAASTGRKPPEFDEDPGF